MLIGSTNSLTPFDSNTWSPVAVALFDHQPVLEARAASTLHEHAQAAVQLLLFGQKLGDLGGCRRRNVNHVKFSWLKRRNSYYVKLYNTPLRAAHAARTVSGSRRNGPQWAEIASKFARI